MTPRPTKEKLEARARAVNLEFEPINRHYSGSLQTTHAAPWALVDTNHDMVVARGTAPELEPVIVRREKFRRGELGAFE